ncbi:hypothetical protein H5410_049004 [Solanum commersonii]|uniref:F-box domain-containing protein n=1 Tax=Solanum commersonii TaxID=4109 RepID=A0A9J5XLC3_SOLCO|nr:hypothetical protein H5410_049004 [Solanum commersonii]
MESEPSLQRTKLTKHSQFPSTSMQDSSSTFANLPSELITEIFLRLPVKSLLQYRLVSKFWLDLISSPRFIKSHLSLLTSNKENTHHKWLMMMFNKNPYTHICSLRSLFNDSVTETSYLNIPMKEPYESYHILSSVNGLICLTCHAGEKEDLILWNPSIRKCRKLPSFESELINVNCYYRYGFIYDEFHDDYKVVVILFEHNRSNRVEVKIYSLRSNSWRSVDHSCPPSGYFLNDCGKFVNGKLHWTTLTSGLGYNTKEISRNIVSIDLADGKWGKVEKPSYVERDIVSRLEVMGNNLSEYGVKESWTEMFTINHYDTPYVHDKPYFMSNKGEVLVGFIQSIKIYNPKDGSFSPKIINFVSFRETAEIYIESLFSPFPSEDQTIRTTQSFSPMEKMESEPFANLTPGLIIEILSRLPVKSLLQYRSVSKYWLDLISTPKFIKSHLSLSTSNKENTHHRLMMRLSRFTKPLYNQCSFRSLLYDSVTETSDLNIPMIKNHYENFHILGSVNGLILGLFLWNPSIRKYKKLPSPSFETRRSYASDYSYCFIYDEFCDDYKVVVILFDFKHANSIRLEVKIYCLMSNSWRRVDNSCPPTGLYFNVSGKFVNGKLYWATNPVGHEYKTMNDGWNIISFDLTDEKWGKAEKPTFGEGDIDSQLEVLGSNLSVFCYNKRRYVSVWVMNEFGVKESWKKMFTINYFDKPYMHEQPYFMSNKGEVLVGFSRSFKIYNPKDNSFKIYIESLVSPFPSEDRTSDATKIEVKKSSDQDNQLQSYSSHEKVELLKKKITFHAPNSINHSQFSSTSMQDSNSTFANLPSELITKIFLRLPVKSLLQYKSVSKYWLDLISSPKFIKSHFSLSNTNKENTHHRLMVRIFGPRNYHLMDCSFRSLLYDFVIETSDLNIPIKEPYEFYHILGSVNGLIFLTYLVDDIKRDLFLWNPSIRKYMKLPSYETGVKDVIHYQYGFIYDEFHDDYKVLVILFNVGLILVEVKIYSLMSNSWTSVDNSCPPSGLSSNICGKFVNGKFHWATTPFGFEYNPMNRNRNIISLIWLLRNGER